MPTKTTTVKVTLPITIARKALKAAEADHRTLAGYIQHVVSTAVEAQPEAK